MSSRPTVLHRCAASAYGSATVAVIAVLLILAAVAVYAISTSTITRGNPSYKRTLEVLGLDATGPNRLADSYTDSDGDLLADAPSDAALRRDPQTIRFAYLSTGAVADAPTKLASLMDRLAEAAGRPVEYVEVGDDGSLLRALHDGRLDVAGFNTGAVPIAVNVAGFLPVAVPAHDGRPATYRMVLIVPAQSPISSPADLKGRTIAFTRWGSNSGFKAPVVLLRDAFGLLPERDYHWTFSRSHAASIAGIADGTYAAAATASDLLAAAVARGDLDESAFRIVYESESFPTAALGVAHDLDPALAQRIADALLSYQPDAAARDALNGATGLSPVNYKDGFALVRRIDDAVGFGHTLPEPAADPAPSAPSAPQAPAD